MHFKMDLEEHDPYLILRDRNSKGIIGLWFHDASERKRISELMVKIKHALGKVANSLHSNHTPSKPATAPVSAPAPAPSPAVNPPPSTGSKPDIMQMLRDAAERSNSNSNSGGAKVGIVTATELTRKPSSEGMHRSSTETPATLAPLPSYNSIPLPSPRVRKNPTLPMYLIISLSPRHLLMMIYFS
jgi:hypothetical protein